MEEKEHLKQALDDYMEEELERLPSNEEVKKNHTFSEAFAAYMKRLIDKEETKKKEKKKWNLKRFNQAAAVLLCFFVVGGILYFVRPIGEKKDAMTEQSAADTTTESDTGSTSPEESKIATVPNQSVESNESFTAQTDQAEQSEEPQELKESSFTLKSLTFDGSFHAKTILQNNSASDMRYTPVYQWSYMLNGETTKGSTDLSTSESASILAAGESIEESFDLQKFGVKRGGGELTLTRQINDKEVSLIIKVEE